MEIYKTEQAKESHKIKLPSPDICPLEMKFQHMDCHKEKFALPTGLSYSKPLSDLPFGYRIVGTKIKYS